MKSLKGRTYEEIYGIKKAKKLKKLRAMVFSKANKGRIYADRRIKREKRKCLCGCNFMKEVKIKSN